MHKKNTLKSFLLLFSWALIGCGKTPLQELQNKARTFGFHPFVLPLEDVRPGGLVAGGEHNLSMVASSSVCFNPEELEGMTTSYKSLDYLYDSLDMDLDMGTKLAPKSLDFLNITFKGSLARKTHVRFNDIRVRSLEVPKLLSLVNSEAFLTNTFCQHLLLEQELGMIGEIIEANGIEISFQDAKGLNIVLSPKNLFDYIKFDNSLGYQIIEKQKLKITGPRGIGYRLYMLGVNKNKHMAYVYGMTSGKTKEDGTFLLEPFKLKNYSNMNIADKYSIQKVPSSKWPTKRKIITPEDWDNMRLYWDYYYSIR